VVTTVGTGLTSAGAATPLSPVTGAVGGLLGTVGTALGGTRH